MNALRLALVLFLAADAALAAPLPSGVLKSAAADLDGDGVAEKIAIEVDGKTGMFVLRIGGQSARDGTRDDQGAPPEGFEIVDIDPADRFKEVVVETQAQCELCGQQTFIYGYDKAVKKIGQLGKGVEFKGYGMVLEYQWQGFWTSQTKYVLDAKTRQLKAVPQPFYSVGLPATVRKSFAIYGRQRADPAEVVANLKPGSAILVVAAEYKPQPRWYLVKSESGLMGWVGEGVLGGSVEGLPSAN